MIALQHRAGNASTVALLRRAGSARQAPPITLTLPGVVEDATVSTWSIHGALREQAIDVELTRPTDADSPRLAQASTEAAGAATATLLVRKLTPSGWIRDMTVTFEDCMINSFETHGEFDSVWLRFTRMKVER